MIRLLVPLPTPAPDTVELQGERHHYLSRVLRLDVGDALEVFDGRGRAWAATVLKMEPASATLSLGAPVERSQAPQIAIVQGLPKGDKLEWVIQKGTELGAWAFAPAVTARAVVKLDEKRAQARQERWQKIAEEAARQCGRSDVPQVMPVRPLLDAVAAFPDARVLVLDEAERAVRLSQAVGDDARPRVLVVGPEGGLAREEVQALVARGAQGVTLGPRVLRTETAPLAALAVLAHLFGELG
jgi:16S rRNA (uracil1498-N3)-methyltransferase